MSKCGCLLKVIGQTHPFYGFSHCVLHDDKFVKGGVWNNKSIVNGKPVENRWRAGGEPIHNTPFYECGTN
jgi:hypothetical protein